MIESDQKTLKVGIHSFPALRLAIKRANMKIGRQVRLLCSSARHLTGLPLSPSGSTGSSGSLTRRPKRSFRCLLVEDFDK